MAFRNTLGVMVPVVMGLMYGVPAVGLAIATGALNVSFTDSQEPYRQRGKRMVFASVLVGFALFAGMMSGHHVLAVVLVAGAWAFAAGMLVALGNAAADLGVISLVTMLVYAAVPWSIDKALAGGGLAILGGLLQTLFAVALWPQQRYGPERELLATLYHEIARIAGTKVEAAMAPPATAQSIQARTSLASLDQDHTVEGERFRLLLSQAERARLGILTLRRLRSRLRREEGGEIELAGIERFFGAAAAALHGVGEALGLRKSADTSTGLLRELSDAAEEFRARVSTQQGAASVMLSDIQFQMDALAGQVRSATDLAASTTPAGLDEFHEKEQERPERLRLGGRVATLRANLTLRSAVCRHAVRLAVCVAIGEGIAQGIGLRRGYWIPMTIAIILKPDFTTTFSRGVLRLGGTMVGLIAATALFHTLPAIPVTEVILIAVSMFALRCYGPANYGIFAVSVTALVVVLIALTGAPPGGVMAARGMNTLLGGGIALVAYWVWPTWERTQVPEALAQMLDAYRSLFRTIRLGYEETDFVNRERLDEVRGAARLARSNVEASIDRIAAEPGTSPESTKALGAILASSHRLVHALMALEAGIGSTQKAPARDAFGLFSDRVELTFYYLSAALRGAAIAQDMLPDLRASHRALLEADDNRTERYALVNVETDRVTNSLNTMSDEVLRWLRPATDSTSQDRARVL